MRSHLAAFFLALSLAAAGAAATDHAAVTLDEAVAIVRAQTDGKVVRAKTRRKNGKVVHEIRVISADGLVQDFRVDGTTGALR